MSRPRTSPGTVSRAQVLNHFRSALHTAGLKRTAFLGNDQTPEGQDEIVRIQAALDANNDMGLIRFLGGSRLCASSKTPL